MYDEEDYQYDDENYYNDYEYQSEQMHQQNYGYGDHGMKATGNSYQVIPQSELYNQLVNIVKQCETYVALPFGWSLLLMKELRWQMENINEYFQNMKKFKDKLKFQEKFKNYNSTTFSQTTDGECLVCCGQGKLRKNICGDQFCEECWLGQIKADINSMNAYPHCLNCPTPILHQFIIDMLSNPSEQKALVRYKKLLCEDFTTANISYQVCLGVDCIYCIKCEDFTTTTVKCICGKSFCFKCKKDDHSPCTCAQRNKWLDLVMKEQADAKWMSINTKLCPWCSKAVERSVGCNYMACLCGKSFCYMCSKPWEPDHKDHFKCHIYKKKNDNQINKQKAILQKMNFHAQQYLNTNKVVSQLKKVDTFEKRRILFQLIGVDLTDSDFIDQAYRFAIQCCEGLKWIYVYKYFVKFQNKQVEEVFDFHQGQYEKYKQNLLVKLSHELHKFIDELQKKQMEGQPINKYQQTQRLLEIKKKITNYYTCTKQFKQKFIQELEKSDKIAKKYSQEKQQESSSKKKSQPVKGKKK